MASFKILPLHEHISIPIYNEGGYEIRAAEDVKITPHVPYCVPTGFKMSFPENFCALITRHNIKTLGGLIDSDYRGEVKVIVVSSQEEEIKQGEIIAKMHLIEIETPEIEVDQGYPADGKTDIVV